MKNRIYLIILIVLAIVATYFFFTNKTSTIQSELNEFEVKDTNEIDKIFIADPDGGTAELTRQENNTWLINGKYKARQDAIDMLLVTFKSIRVKEPIAQAAQKNIIRALATKNIKVEIYTGEGKPEKVYYIGNATPNHFGTYMLLEIDGQKSSVPFVTHIPGFFGYLTARFFTDQKLWRDRAIFEFEPDEIESIQIGYSEKPLKSFKLIVENGIYTVIDLNTGNAIEPLYTDAISEYLSRFKSIHFEQIVTETPLDNIDSVISTIPLQIIEVKGKDGRKTTVKTYRKPVKESMVIDPNTGNTYTHDLDRAYGWINETDFVTIQWPTLDNILSYNTDFQKTEIVDN